MIITKQFSFEAAHKLIKYDGLCKNLHGHSYILQVSISGKIGTNGMVLDFVNLKNIVIDNVIIILDHAYLNDILKQPTAENLAIWIWNELKTARLPVYEVKLWETQNSFVTYMGE